MERDIFTIPVNSREERIWGWRQQGSVSLAGQDGLVLTEQFVYHLIYPAAENRQDPGMSLSNNGTNSISMSVEINGIVYTGKGNAARSPSLPLAYPLPNPLLAQRV